MAGGCVLLAVCLLIGRWVGGPTPATGLATAARAFMPLWLVAAGINSGQASPRLATRSRTRRRSSSSFLRFRSRSHSSSCGGCHTGRDRRRRRFATHPRNGDAMKLGPHAGAALSVSPGLIGGVATAAAPLQAQQHPARLSHFVPHRIGLASALLLTLGRRK